MIGLRGILIDVQSTKDVSSIVLYGQYGSIETDLSMSRRPKSEKDQHTLLNTI